MCNFSESILENFRQLKKGVCGMIVASYSLWRA